MPLRQNSSKSIKICLILVVLFEIFQAGHSLRRPQSKLKRPAPDTFCPKNGDGYHQHPDDCAKFVRCVQQGNYSSGPTFARFDFDCAPGTVYDPMISSCNFAGYTGSMPGCKGKLDFEISTDEDEANIPLSSLKIRTSEKPSGPSRFRSVPPPPSPTPPPRLNKDHSNSNANSNPNSKSNLNQNSRSRSNSNPAFKTNLNQNSKINPNSKPNPYSNSNLNSKSNPTSNSNPYQNQNLNSDSDPDPRSFYKPNQNSNPHLNSNQKFDLNQNSKPPSIKIKLPCVAVRAEKPYKSSYLCA